MGLFSKELPEHLTDALTALAKAARILCEAKTSEILQGGRAGLATKSDLMEMEKRIMAGQEQLAAALGKIDTATTKIAENISIIAETDKKISDEIDAFLAANPVGTVMTDAQVEQLGALAERAQAASDASSAQVEVLKAIATKGETNPVPVPVPAPPVIAANA